MSEEKKKPELTHEFEQYGCTIRQTLDGEYATVTDRDGVTQEFEENLGMIVQGAASAVLLAIHAAKADLKKREEAAAQERARVRAERLLAKAAPPSPPVATPTVVDSPMAGTDEPKPKRGK